MKKQQVIEVKMNTGVKFVKFDSIVFITTFKRHAIVTLSDNTSFEAFHSIKWFEQMLSKPDFSRCHNSFIVHCRFIVSLDYTSCKLMLNGFGEIPYSRKLKSAFVTKYAEFVAAN